MRNLSNLLSGFVLLSVFVAAITFTYFNTDSVTITFGTSLRTAAGFGLDNRAFVPGSVRLAPRTEFLLSAQSRAKLKRMTKDLENARREVKQCVICPCGISTRWRSCYLRAAADRDL